MRIQEIAEELVNLSAHEVQELSMLMNKNDGELPIPIVRPELKIMKLCLLKNME